MFAVRIHGRGGQGAVTAAEMLSVAAFDEGRHAQAFPTFGSERTGAPVVSFCRIDDRPIRLREPISHPDALIVQDPTLLHQVDLFAGMKPECYLLVNTSRTLDELGLAELVGTLDVRRVATVPATELAREHLGRPLPNAALLGGFAALTGQVGLAAVQKAILDRFSGSVGEGNARAAEAAYEHVLSEHGSRQARSPEGDGSRQARSPEAGGRIHA
jgi:pyruvate ferredoxin oxidoreductase gamma subunit